MIDGIFGKFGYVKTRVVEEKITALTVRHDEMLVRQAELESTIAVKKRVMKRYRIEKRSFNSVLDEPTLGRWISFRDNINELLATYLDKIVSRSREKYYNNSYAKRVVKIIRNNVIGEFGIRLQCRFQHKNELLAEINEEIESKFALWGEYDCCDIRKKSSFTDIQNLVVTHLVRDGEAIVRKHRGKYNRFGFAIEIIDPKLLDVTYNRKKQYKQNKIECGIELDDFDRAVAYYFKDGDDLYGREQLVRIPADDLLHLYISENAGQLRGIPWLNTALKELHKLDGYIDAELTAARVCSGKMGFFTKPNRDTYTGEDKTNENLEIAISPGSFEELPNGMDFKSFDPQHPNNNFDMFLKVNLRGVAAAAGISYHSLSNDLENVNFSSIRAALLEEREEYKAVQRFLIEHFCVPVYREFLEMAILTRQIKVAAERIDDYYMPNWLPRRWAWVDPLKDTKANIEAIKTQTKSRTQVCSEQGTDFEHVIIQLAHEEKIAKKNNIDLQGIYKIKDGGGED